MIIKLLTITLLMSLVSSCTGIRVGDGRTIVTAEKSKPFCTIDKVDPNCKIEDNTH